MAVRTQFAVALIFLFVVSGCQQGLEVDREAEEPDAGSPAEDASGDDGDNGHTDNGDEDAGDEDAGGKLDAGDEDAAGKLDAGDKADSDRRPDAGGDTGRDTGGELDAGDSRDGADGGGQVDTGDAGDGKDGSGGAGGADGGQDGGQDGGEDSGQDPACTADDPYPSTLKNAGNLSKTQGTFEFVARDGNTLTVHTHRSPKFDPTDGQIVFIMHGAGRNADGYLDAWRSEIDKHNALAIAPEFPKDDYPGSEDYQLGVGTSGTPYTGTYDPSDWRDSDEYTHSEIEHLFEALRTELGNTSCRYSIYGHSAGSQFVHRLLTFRPDARVDTAVAANAGWYTLPSDGGGYDEDFYMPYGLQGAPPDSDRLEDLFAHDLVVLLGEDDTDRDDYLRTWAEADAQGQNRLERGKFYHATGKQEAQLEGVPFNWTLDTVPNVGHSNSGMTPAAASHIFGP